MAYVPKTKNLASGVDSAAMINAVLNSSDTFAAIPRAQAGNVETIHTIGQMIDRNKNYYNAFVDTLFNRIIMEIIQTLYFTNPLRRLKRGFLEAGDMVEEIAFRLCNPHQYDSTGDGEFPKQERPQVEANIHKINYQKYYKTTVNKKDLLRAFVSYNGMEEFVREQISILYTTAEVDEYVAMKYMIGRSTLNHFIAGIEVTGTTDERALKQLSAKLRATSNNMNLVKTRYNFTHVPTRSEKRQQLVIINSDVEAYMDVEVLADAFNMSKAEFADNRLMIDSFTYDDVNRMNLLFAGEEGYIPFTAAELALLNSIQAWLVDERFFMIFDAEFEMTQFFNPEKLYFNFWLHTWKVMSFSTFVNAVAFTPNVSAPTGFTLAAAPATVTKGNTSTITATFAFGDNVPEMLPNVEWSIDTADVVSTLQPISENTALLNIASNETNSEISISAKAYLLDGTELTADAITVTVSNA